MTLSSTEINQLIYGVVLSVGLGFFAWTLFQRLLKLFPSPKTIRWDYLPQRIYGVIVYVFFQKRLLREPVIGVIHTLIFWGFCILTLGSINFLIQGYYPHFYIPFTHNAFFQTTFDVFNILVIVAVLAAVGRRLFVKPKRILPTWDALLILGLIFTLMLSDLISGDNFGVIWWIHAVTLLGFLCYLPFSKHFHVITAVPDVFFRSLTPAGLLTKLDLENAEQFGVEKLAHLHWKNKLDAYSCTECGRCTSVCPPNVTGKKLDPRKIVMGVRDHMAHKDPDVSLHQDTISEEELWACTTCAACLDACPILIEQLPIITSMRQHLVLMEGKLPDEASNALRNIETQENPWGMSGEQREAWMVELKKDGITVPRMSQDKPVEVLVWVGCASALDERSKKIIKNLCKILEHAHISYGVLGKEEACTGDPARRMGNEYLFQMMATKNTSTLNQYQYEKILTTCPHCFSSFKNEYSEFGLQDKPVLHHSVYINELIAAKKLSFKDNTDLKKITLHDSCYLTRYNDIVEEPREVLNQAGATLIEMERSKKQNFCCGAGGGRMWMEEKVGTPVNINRAQEAVDTKADAVLTECPFCMTMMEDGTKSISAEAGQPKMPVYDIAEWVAMNLNA
jgi:Fe-S oxidoreductase